MISSSHAFSSFSVSDTAEAKRFYQEVLGLSVREESVGGLQLLNLELGPQHRVMIYPKDDHTPATFTVLNFSVENINDEVRDLANRGVKFEHNDETDQYGISRQEEGPTIAWFKDPFGNFLSLIEEQSEATEDGFKIKHTYPTSPEAIFPFWTRPELLELWAAPHGTTLEVSFFEARDGGHYLFEHKDSKDQIIACSGYLKEFIPDQKLVQIETVVHPDGHILYNHLETVVEFRVVQEGVELSVSQRGFPDEDSLRECEASWHQCLCNLERVLATFTSTGLTHNPPAVDREARLI